MCALVPHTGPIWKGKTAKQMRDARRREIKTKDRAFQSAMPFDARCLVLNETCQGQLVKHHRITRRRVATRWDDGNAWILCCHHHEEIERIDERRFKQKYGIT